MNGLVGRGLEIGSIRYALSTSFYEEAELGKQVLVQLNGLSLTLGYSNGSIDAMYFLNPVTKDKSGPTVIYFVGMGDVYERLGISNYACESVVYRYLEAGMNVLLWNYPHVSHSTGSPSLLHLMDGCESVVYYVLHECNVPEEEILLHGHSMGGAIAVHFATLRNEEGGLIHPKLNVCNERSFCDLEKVVEEMIHKKIPLFGKQLGHVCGTIISGFCEWNLNTLEVWNPKDTEGYYWVIHHIDDEIVPEDASLAFQLRKQRRDLHKIIDMDPSNKCTIGIETIHYDSKLVHPCHERPFLPSEWKQHLYHLHLAIPKIGPYIEQKEFIPRSLFVPE